jgi:hypothetical protein
MSTMRKLLSIFIILLVYALGAIAEGANPDDSTASSKFKAGDRVWTTTDLKVRSEPGLNSTQIDSMADGNSMIKGNTGTILEGPISKDDYTWWKISYDIGITGWSAEKYLELVSDGPKQPDNFAQWSDDAVKWATDKDRIGSRNWNGECLRFVSNAFRQKDVSGESGWSTAINAARELYRFDQEQGGWQHAPKGAVIFFDKKGANPDGHVGIYLGDGKNIINAYGTIQELSIEDAMAKGDVGKYIGWAYPPEAWRPETSSKSQLKQPPGEIANIATNEPKPTDAIIQTSASETDFPFTPNNVQNNKVFNIVVIGDSIAWGAGLTKYEKYSYLVAKWIAEQSGRPVNVKVLAHTGATLKKKTDDPIIQYPDIPSSNPTLFEQVDKISNPDNVDLVLVSGGANDVDLKKLNSLDYGWVINTFLGGSTLDEIQTQSWDEIETPMYDLLKKLLNKCPNAKIVVTGYYSAISKDSKELTKFYKAFAPESQFPRSDYKNADDPTQLYELATKTDTFYKKSNLALNSAKIRAKKDSGQNRIEFARIVFPPDKSYGTDDSWLWKIEGTEGNYRTDDHKYDVRASLAGMVCDFTDRIPVCDNPTESKLAAVGHPNVDGSAEYNRTIVQKISETWPDLLHPMVLDIQVSPPSVSSGESFKINYKVSSNCSKGLKQVELWRKNESSDWQQIKTNELSGEIGLTSGSFTDSPSAPGKYLYGVHVVDNAGNWNNEKNSNTNNQPGSYGPVEVEVKEAQSNMASNQRSDSYTRTNEYLDNSTAICTPGSIIAKCSSPDACIGCNGNCYSSGTHIGGGWVCDQGKWNNALISTVLNLNNGHYYKLVAKNLNWNNAKVYAENQQFTDPNTRAIYRGHLATIASPEESSWVVQNLISSLSGQSKIWLGGYQEEGYEGKPSEGWHWITGEPWSWTNWNSGEPNDYDSNERYLELWGHANGRWSDEDVYHVNNKYLLIEYETIA